MAACPDFSDIGPNEKRRVACRFGAANNSYLAAGETLTGTPTVSVVDLAGVDTNPSAILSNVAIGTWLTDPASSAILATIGPNCVPGAVYQLDFYGATSASNQAEGTCHIRCRALL